MLSIEFDTNNAAFHDQEDIFNPDLECSRILHDLAEKLISSMDWSPVDEYRQYTVVDINGNRIGRMVINPELHVSPLAKS